MGRAREGWVGRARYPEVLLVEHSPLLMELLCRQVEMQPLGASCWGGRHAAADEAQLVVMASDIAGRVEDLYCTGYMGPKDRGARCVLKGAVEASELPPLRVDPPPLWPRERPPAGGWGGAGGGPGGEARLATFSGQGRRVAR